MKRNQNWMRLAALVLCAALALILAGCGAGQKTSAEGKIQQAAKNISKVKSMEYDMTTTMEMSMAGEALAMDMTFGVVLFKDPMKMKMTMDLSSMGESMSMDMYMIQEGSSYIMYAGSMGQWQKAVLSEEEMEEQLAASDIQQSIDLYVGKAGNFKEMGYEDVEGVSALKIQGMISGDSLKEVMEASGILENLGTDLDDMGAELVKKIIDNAGDLPVTIWVDEGKLLPLKYELDMTDMARSMYSVMFEEMGVSAEEAGFGVDNFFMSMTCGNFDSAQEFEVPEEALSASEG